MLLLVATMPAVQKISVSLDPSMLGFIDRYAATHSAKGRSAVVAKALQLLQRVEQESALATAYAQSAEHDQQIDTAFAGTVNDGLVSADAALAARDEAW